MMAEETKTELTVEQRLAALEEQNKTLGLKVKEAETERDQYKSRAEEHESKLKEIEGKDLETRGEFKQLYEQTRREYEDFRTQSSQRDIDREIRAYAISEGIVDDTLAALIPRDGVKMENGRIVGVEEAVKGYKASKPVLFKQGTGGGGPAPGVNATGSGNSPAPGGGTPSEGSTVKGLKREDYNKAKKDYIGGLRRAG